MEGRKGLEGKKVPPEGFDTVRVCTVRVRVQYRSRLMRCRRSLSPASSMVVNMFSFPLLYSYEYEYCMEDGGTLGAHAHALLASTSHGGPLSTINLSASYEQYDLDTLDFLWAAGDRVL